MNKAILLSVRPYWAYLIWKLIKTLELRKIVPKFINLNAYIYVTIRPQDLKKIPEEHREMVKSWLGKVPMRFWFDEYEEIEYETIDDYSGDLEDVCYNNKNYEQIVKKACLDYELVKEYSKGKYLYAWHIKNLEIFDEPMELSNFYKIPKSIKGYPENYIKMDLERMLDNPLKVTNLFM